MTPPRSLKSRALQLLAQREQSRVELRRKLLMHARALELVGRADGADRADPPFGSALDAPSSLAEANPREQPAAAPATPFSADSSPQAQVDVVLAWLEARGFLNTERFAESRVNARSARFGNLRIRHELGQHGVTLPDDLSQTLEATEFERAAMVLERKFGATPPSPLEAARQARFLAGRGFSADVIRRALRRKG